MTITRPFGPKIGVIKLPKNIVDKLISITDELIVDEERKNYGCALVGQIKEEVRISNELLEKEDLYGVFQQYLGDYIAYCLKESCIHYNDEHTLDVALTDIAPANDSPLGINVLFSGPDTMSIFAANNSPF